MSRGRKALIVVAGSVVAAGAVIVAAVVEAAREWNTTCFDEDGDLG